MDEHRLFLAMAGAVIILLYIALWLIGWLFSAEDDPGDEEAWNQRYEPK